MLNWGCGKVLRRIGRGSSRQFWLWRNRPWSIRRSSFVDGLMEKRLNIFILNDE